MSHDCAREIASHIHTELLSCLSFTVFYGYPACRSYWSKQILIRHESHTHTPTYEIRSRRIKYSPLEKVKCIVQVFTSKVAFPLKTGVSLLLTSTLNEVCCCAENPFAQSISTPKQWSHLNTQARLWHCIHMDCMNSFTACHFCASYHYPMTKRWMKETKVSCPAPFFHIPQTQSICKKPPLDSTGSNQPRWITTSVHPKQVFRPPNWERIWPIQISDLQKKSSRNMSESSDCGDRTCFWWL